MSGINTFEKELSAEDYAKLVYEDGDSLVVNLEEVAEQKFEAIPKGIYNAVVDQVEFMMSKNSGHPMFQFIFKVDGGDYNGRKLYFYASFSPKALSSTKTSLLKLDPTIFTGPFKPKEIADSGSLLGKPCRIKVDHEDYNGEKRARIQYLMPPAAVGAGGSGGGFFGG